MNSIKIQFSVIILLIFSAIMFGQTPEFSGYGATGFKFYDRNQLNGTNQETYYEGKVQLEYDVEDEIEAQLDFRGNSIDNAVELREFSVKLKYWKYLRIKIGNIKRPFGYEYMINREKLWTIDRSIVQDKFSELGYGTRTVGFLIYHNYDKDDRDFPYSYHLGAYKDNSQTSAFAARFTYHFDNHWNTSVNYMMQTYGGETDISVNGFAADVNYNTKRFNCDLEFMMAQDPVKGRIYKLAGLDENVAAMGVKFLTSYKFDIDGSKIFKDIEPLLTLGYFVPDTDIDDQQTIQVVAGVNVYLDKRVRFRLNGDLRLTELEHNEEFTTKESRGVFEIQVRL